MHSDDIRPEFRASFLARAGGRGQLDFAEFVELALYDPSCGYYRRSGARVGYGPGTDFFTASTSGPLFGELVAAACEDLLGAASAREHMFVEIGAEPGGGVLAGARHSFPATRTIRLGDPLALSGRCIVFSNELFDAQPFRRFAFRHGRWRELGVALHEAKLVEVELATPTPDFLPATAPEGYVLDAPMAAVSLAERIAAQPWTGLFLAFDYGKIWDELSTEHPRGTARAYHRHRQSNHLLERPGEQDLTCHVCWDWIGAALEQQGFSTPRIESQETFLVRRATTLIARISEAEAAHFSRQKLALMQLLHPAQLGQRFQVMHALRTEPGQAVRGAEDCP